MSWSPLPLVVGKENLMSGDGGNDANTGNHRPIRHRRNKEAHEEGYDKTTKNKKSTPRHAHSHSKLKGTGYSSYKKSPLFRLLFLIALLFLIWWIRVCYFIYLPEYTVHWKSPPIQQAHALWKGEVVESPSFDNHRKIQLVISHCDKSLAWIFHDFAPGFVFDSITIYSKCGVPVQGLPTTQNNILIITNLPNVGRCDHTYAHWLAEAALNATNHNNNIPTNDRDIVLFLKDNSNTHRLLFTVRRTLPQMIQLADTYGFSCHEDRWWLVGRTDYQYGSVFDSYCSVSYFHNKTELFDYATNHYQRLSRDKNDNFLAPSEYSNLGQWITAMTNTNTNMGGSGNVPATTASTTALDQELVPVCYGGNFLFKKSSIANYPPSVYQKIETSLARGNNIAEGHYAERSWASILSKPLQRKQVETLKELSTSSTTCRHPQFPGALPGL